MMAFTIIAKWKLILSNTCSIHSHRPRKHMLRTKEWNIKPRLTVESAAGKCHIHLFNFQWWCWTSNKVENEMKWKWWHTTFNIYDKSSQVHTLTLKRRETLAHKTTFRWRTCFECTNQPIAGWLFNSFNTWQCNEYTGVCTRWVVRKAVTIWPNVRR